MNDFHFDKYLEWFLPVSFLFSSPFCPSNLQTSLNPSSPKRCHPAIFFSPNASSMALWPFLSHCGFHETSLSALQPILHHPFVSCSLAARPLFLSLYRKCFAEHNWSSNLIAFVSLPDLLYSITEISHSFWKSLLIYAVLSWFSCVNQGLANCDPEAKFDLLYFLGKPLLWHSHAYVVSMADFTL